MAQILNDECRAFAGRLCASVPGWMPRKRMAEDDIAVLLQEAISELQASRKTLLKQNQQLVNQNAELTQKVNQVVETHSHGDGRRKSKPKVEVSRYVGKSVWSKKYYALI